MVSDVLLSVPASLKPISHLVKISNNYAQRDIVLYYWCLFKAVEDSMKLDNKSPEARDYIMKLLTLLEKIKTANPENDSIKSPNVVAQAYVEDQAQRLFDYAESQDSQGIYSQKVVQAFYTAGYLFDVLTVFGELDEHIQSAKKYAQWRATHIHQCLKSGDTPTPGQRPQQTAQVDETTSPSGTVTQPYGGGVGGGDEHASNTISSMRINSVDGGGAYSPPPQQPQKPQQHMGGGAVYPAAKAASSGGQGLTSVGSAPAPLSSKAHLSLEDFIEAKKLVKYAASALDYEDASTAVDNMRKAIAILENRRL